MSFFVYEFDLGIYLKTNGNFAHLTFKRGEHTVEVEVEKIAKFDQKNMWLAEAAQTKCWALVKTEANSLIKYLRKFDTKADGPAAKKRDLDVDKLINKFEQDLVKDLVPVCMAVFKDFAKDKSDYKSYVTKTGCKIVINGAMLAASAVLTGLGGWSGVGTVVGIVGMTRSAATIAQQIANQLSDISTVYKRLEGNVAKMEKQLTSPNLKKNTAKEIAGTVLNKVFAVEIQTLVVTVDGLESDLNLLEMKVRKVKIEAVSLSGKIPKLLEDQEKAQKEYDKLVAAVKKTGQQVKDESKAEATLKKIEKDLDTLLNDVHDMSKKMLPIDAWASKQHAAIADMKKKYNKNAVQVASVATDLVISAASFVAGDFSKPGQLISDLHTSSTQIVASLSLANDGASTLKDYGEAIYDNAT